MKKELKERLLDMQANPTTGTAHNHQLITTQVETIFVVDELKDEITKLSQTIISLDKQNQNLEKKQI
ncbi:MAG TPA: hypothetical protein VLG67_05365 [Candidatus Saccharimonadales bacterium]|nr:hypothetical protein [Candidatus Saccharimonadales bacterium]